MKTYRYTLTLTIALLLLVIMRADNGKLFTAENQLSSSKISCITQDSFGYLWVGTEYGLNKFDGYHFSTFLNNPNDSLSIPSNEVTTFLADSKGRLWVGCSKGLATYNPDDNTFTRYRFPDKITPRVEAILENSHGDIVIGTAGYGLFAIKKGENNLCRLRSFTRNNNDEFASHMFEDRQHHLWRNGHLPFASRTKVETLTAKATKDFPLGEAGPVANYLPTHDGLLLVCMYGILRYDYRTQTVVNTSYDMSLLDRQVSIRTALTDHKGNIYIGTSGRGVFIIPKGSRRLQPVESIHPKFDLASANVNALFEDKDHNLWASCYNKGLYLLSEGKNAFSSWLFSTQAIRLGSSVSSIAPADEGGVWCTVQKSGIYHFDAHGNITDKRLSPEGANTIYRDRQGRYWVGTENALYRYYPSNGSSQLCLKLDGWGVNYICDDGQGSLFVSNYAKGFVIYDTKTGKSRSFSMQHDNKKLGKLHNDWAKTMLYDRQGRLWIACADGLSCMNPKTGNFRINGWETLFDGRQCLSLCQLRQSNTMLIGTENGLYQLSEGQKAPQRFPNSDNLADKSIYAIVQDADGDLWMSTSMGIWQYDHKSKKLISYIGGNGLTTTEYVIGTQIHTSDDRIFFGINDGVTTFLPKAVKASNQAIGRVFLTRMVVNGKERGCQSRQFDLDYDDNTFSLGFSLLNYRNTNNITFQYRIGKQGAWEAFPEGSNVITFNKMKPGTYRIEVRATTGGAYSAHSAVVTVRVNNPWYASTWAWLTYILAATGIVAFAIYYVERRRKVEMEEAKMRFLINATHDIRSPLTLILGPLRKLKERLTDQESQSCIDTIDRNAQRLLLLVNQILDERRIDKNQLQLHCQATDLVKTVGAVCSMYQYNARQRHINLRFDHNRPMVKAWIDRINFEKVLSNLLSNAFKYTPDGGEIVFTINETPQTVVITLTDSGTGLKETKTEKLFERFYQGNNAQIAHTEGTGIGLNLSKAIVALHGGTIKAYNRQDGHSGACFEVTLQRGHAHLKNSQIVTKAEEATSDLPQKRRQSNKGMNVMVVDDDRELAQYIANELGKWYRCTTFANGKEALKELLTGHYDLVVSDVIMPEMDGIELLKAIKSNTTVNDIPVILLTSKNEADHRLEGLKYGADAYLGKPFSMEELHTYIDNLIDNVRRLKGKFSGAQKQEDKFEHREVKGNNDALMERIMRSVNSHLADSTFNVERLTQEVGISRAQLHRKMKEMTGISTADFIRNLRLDEAARLIRETDITVTQAAYSVGFNNQSHFSTVFHKRFGMTPTEYQAQKKNPKPTR